MSRENAINRATAYFDQGCFFADLARRIAIPTESQNKNREAEMSTYLTEEIGPDLEKLGYQFRLLKNIVTDHLPFLFAEKIEGGNKLTVLTYGHGDVIHGLDGDWDENLSPWQLQKKGDLWYGRGTADNKGQHTINIAALAAVLAERKSLGFNSKILIEMGEEAGSPGLQAICKKEKKLLSANVLISSDGSRVTKNQPTIFTGNRGQLRFTLEVDLRKNAHHSGNWGGLLANPGMIIAQALSSIVGENGQILVPEILPDSIPESIKATLADVVIDQEGPEININWGEPGLSPAEKIFAWNSFEVLALIAGNPNNPVGAIPPKAAALCEIRFVLGKDPHQLLAALRSHLDKHGFSEVKINLTGAIMPATLVAPDNPWIEWARKSLEKTVGEKPVIIPNIGGTLPNYVFTDILEMPTLWVPHSYSSCCQHGPNEHLSASLMREGLQIMTGLFWDLGEGHVHGINKKEN